MPNNHRAKPWAVVVTILGTLVALGVVGIFARSALTARAQSSHESSAESHPVIQQAVETVVEDVGEIRGDVKEMMRVQERQTVILEQIGDDIGELKEANP